MTRLVPLLLVLGCATPPRSYRLPDGPYGVALETATKSAVVRRGFDSALIMYVTYDSPGFKKARADRLAEMFAVSPLESETKVGTLALGGPGPTFTLAVYTGQRFANELEKASSIWALHLRTPKGTLVPEKIERLPFTHTLETLYPYVDVFFVTYRVTFPAFEGSGPVVLNATGPAGAAELSF